MPDEGNGTTKNQENLGATASAGHPSSANVNNGNNANIRKYLVLLQDCLAIKFVSISQLQQQQRRLQQDLTAKSPNFPNPSSSAACCHCCCSDDVVGTTVTTSGGDGGGGVGGDCRATTVAASLANNPSNNNNNGNNRGSSSSTLLNPSNCNNKGRKWDWKSNNHKAATASSKDSNDRGDHQECQFYRHQANQVSYYPHEDSPQSQSSSAVKGSSRSSTGNNGGGGSGITPTGDRVNHQIPLLVITNKSNKSSSSVNNKEEEEEEDDDDDVGNGNQCCGCSTNNAEWESGQQMRHQQQQQTGHYLKKHHHQQGPTQHCNYVPQQNDHLGFSSHHKGTSCTLKEGVYSVNNNICRGSKHGQLEGNGLLAMNKVDHSMQALFLYKEFREINLQCFWNSALHEAFKHLEYKGSVVPSTVIVGSPIQRHLTILKTAWSRKMLKSPAGYVIDFLGEIEELIADPIAKSHFVPLSDSLCWAIHELTSSGQEAFVDDIFLSLAFAFPGMALPTKELIYQTLEKLTRERKIYQTAQGYFVVTPDTHRYIMSTEPLLMQANRADSKTNATVANFLRNSILQQASLQRVTTPLPESRDTPLGQEGAEKDESGERTPSPPPSPDPDTYSLPYGTFRRYNSLRIRKDPSGTTGCLPRRTLSMRLPKSKSKAGSKAIPNHASDQVGKRADVTGSFQNLDSSQPCTVNEQLLSRRRKHKSFLSRLLSFRGVRKSSRKEKAGRSGGNSNKAQQQQQQMPRNDKSAKAAISSDCGNGASEEKNASPGGGKTCNKHATISTQTSFSIENLNADLNLLSLAATSKSSTLEREDSDSGRCTDSHSDADAEITAALNRGLTPDGRRREIVGGSHSSSCNVYEKIESDLGLKVDVDECDGRSPRSPSSQMSVSPSPSTFTGGGNRHNLYSRCHSSASSSGYSYRDFYNLYRRRYPSYQQSTPTSLESAELIEGLKFKPLQPIRYPPRSFERKQIFDEISRSSFKDKKSRKAVSIANNVSTIDNEKLSRAGQHESSESIVNANTSNNGINNKVHTTINESSAAGTTTTTLTQTLKNTTNLELEFRLPLGSLISTAMGGGNLTSTINTSPSSNDKLGSERSTRNESNGTTTSNTNNAGKVGERECTLSEVNTMVNDLFTIKSFVKTNPFSDELSSTIEFKARGNGKASNHNNLKPCYVIETVSSKPFADIHTKFQRESEII